MRKFRILVISSDKYIGPALCDIFELEDHHATLVMPHEDWALAYQIYMPDMVIIFEFYPITVQPLLDFFCGIVPVMQSVWRNRVLDIRLKYWHLPDEITFYTAPIEIDDLLVKFEDFITPLKHDLLWLEVAKH